jgi:hypothetical protein
MGDIQQATLASTDAFPRVDRYLARLPLGFDSYPECTAKASVYRVFCESRSLRGFAWRSVHPKIADMLRTPVAPTTWLPEVAVVSTILAVADHLQLDDDETVRWFRECNASLLSNRMYRALMTLASPAMLVRAGAARWGTLHRGSGFGVALREHGAYATITFPPFLYNDVVLRGQGEGLRTALSMSRAKECSFTIVRSTPRSCEYHFDWAP